MGGIWSLNDVFIKTMFMNSRIRTYFEAIKFEHTVFALPFAYIGMLLAAAGWPGWTDFILVTIAMAGARTGAMAANRVIDAAIDARNPRTNNRAIPAGIMSKKEMTSLAIIGFVMLHLAAWQLNATALKLAPLAALMVTIYPYAKRFTWSSHWCLGLADSVAAVGGWIAIRGEFGWSTVLLALAMMFWIAGFDVVYSCQDVDVDRSQGLYSIPARFGIDSALWVSRLSHLVTVVCLIALGLTYRVDDNELGWPYWIGVGMVVLLLIYEAALVRANDLSKLQKAFFDMNGIISIVLLGAVILGLVVGLN